MKKNKKTGIRFSGSEDQIRPLTSPTGDLYWDPMFQLPLHEKAPESYAYVDYKGGRGDDFTVTFSYLDEKGKEVLGSSKNWLQSSVPASEIRRVSEELNKLHQLADDPAIPKRKREFFKNFVLPDPNKLPDAWRVSGRFKKRLYILWGYTSKAGNYTFLPQSPCSEKNWEDESREDLSKKMSKNISNRLTFGLTGLSWFLIFLLLFILGAGSYFAYKYFTDPSRVPFDIIPEQKLVGKNISSVTLTVKPRSTRKPYFVIPKQSQNGFWKLSPEGIKTENCSKDRTSIRYLICHSETPYRVQVDVLFPSVGLKKTLERELLFKPEPLAPGDKQILSPGKAIYTEYNFTIEGFPVDSYGKEWRFQLIPKTKDVKNFYWQITRLDSIEKKTQIFPSKDGNPFDLLQTLAFGASYRIEARGDVEQDGDMYRKQRLAALQFQVLIHSDRDPAQEERGSESGVQEKEGSDEDSVTESDKSDSVPGLSSPPKDPLPGGKENAEDSMDKSDTDAPVSGQDAGGPADGDKEPAPGEASQGDDKPNADAPVSGQEAEEPADGDKEPAPGEASQEDDKPNADAPVSGQEAEEPADSDKEPAPGEASQGEEKPETETPAVPPEQAGDVPPQGDDQDPAESGEKGSDTDKNDPSNEGTEETPADPPVAPQQFPPKNSGANKPSEKIANYNFQVILRNKNNPESKPVFTVIPVENLYKGKFSVRNWTVNGIVQGQEEGNAFTPPYEFSLSKRYTILAEVTIDGRPQPVMPYQWNRVDVPIWKIIRNDGSTFSVVCINTSDVEVKDITWDAPQFFSPKKRDDFQNPLPFSVKKKDSGLRTTLHWDIGDYIGVYFLKMGVVVHAQYRGKEITDKRSDFFEFHHGYAAEGLLQAKYTLAKDKIYFCLANTEDGEQLNGTALAVSDHYLLTNYHVAIGSIDHDMPKRHYRIKGILELSNDRVKHPLYAKAIKFCKEKDIALLQLCDRHGILLDHGLDNYFMIANTDDFMKLKKDHQVMAIGYPRGTVRMGPPDLAFGALEEVAKDPDGNWILIHNSKIKPGYSGGPLIDLSNGKVLGVNWGVFKTGDGVFSISLAASALDVRNSFPEIFSKK